MVRLCAVVGGGGAGDSRMTKIFRNVSLSKAHFSKASKVFSGELTCIFADNNQYYLRDKVMIAIKN